MAFDSIESCQEALIEAGEREQAARNSKDWAACKKIDDKNQSLLKNIITKHGWPIRSKFGDKAETAAFLIAQHSSQDLAFMESCLQLRQALPAGETDLAQTAMMEDRVRMFQGKPQRYGTQIAVDNETGRNAVHQIEGIDMKALMKGDRLQTAILEARRADIGYLKPYRDYIAKFDITIDAPTTRGRPR